MIKQMFLEFELFGSELFAVFDEGALFQRLGEDVGDHVGGGLVDEVDFLAFDFASDEVVLDVDVLGAWVIYIVLRHCDAALVRELLRHHEELLE